MRDGIYKRQYTEFKEFKSSNKNRSVPFKDSGKVSERTGYNALLGLKETDKILQNKTMCVPCEGTFTVVFDQQFRQSSEDRDSLCKADESQI